MSATLTSPPPPFVIPPEVIAFAAEKGASEYLPKLAAFLQQLFPGQTLTVKLEDDPELSYNRTIVFTVVIRGWSEERVYQAEDQWGWDIVKFCPTTHTHVFGLRVRTAS